MQKKRTQADLTMSLHMHIFSFLQQYSPWEREIDPKQIMSEAFIVFVSKKKIPAPHILVNLNIK